MVNIVGDHATYHSHFDAPLTSDVEGWPAPCLTGFGVPAMLPSAARDGAEAVRAALSAPGQIGDPRAPRRYGLG